MFVSVGSFDSCALIANYKGVILLNVQNFLTKGVSALFYSETNVFPLAWKW